MKIDGMAWRDRARTPGRVLYDLMRTRSRANSGTAPAPAPPLGRAWNRTRSAAAAGAAQWLAANGAAGADWRRRSEDCGRCPWGRRVEALGVREITPSIGENLIALERQVLVSHLLDGLPGVAVQEDRHVRRQRRLDSPRAWVQSAALLRIVTSHLEQVAQAPCGSERIPSGRPQSFARSSRSLIRSPAGIRPLWRMF